MTSDIILHRIATRIALAMAITVGVFASTTKSAARQKDYDAAVIESITLLEEMLHLRSDGAREWDSFPESPDATGIDLGFDSEANSDTWTLELRQQDVKQTWRVAINGTDLGRLTVDENDMRVYFDVPPELITQGTNRIVVSQPVAANIRIDDIRVGQVVLHQAPKESVLGQSTLSIRVIDKATGAPGASRITVLDEQGVLQTLDVEPHPSIAVRPGTIYTSTGECQIALPAGRYLIYAGRGFEYSLDSTSITAHFGEHHEAALAIEREVATEGYVACDTHTHTLTHSGHGDATIEERMVTLVGEGIELPIATDHNVNIDQRPFAIDAGVEKSFTTVIGNEVTTPIGHFNVFPIAPQAEPPNHQHESWSTLFDDIDRTEGVQVKILNHARDLHSQFRPCGPSNYLSSVGFFTHGWPVGFNAMEVVNSSATQTEPLQLLEDWMSLLNAGHQIAPIGCSDSHDVGRHFIGQGRTYIRVDDADPGNIDVALAARRMTEGKVMVSYGLAVEAVLADQFRSGELADIPSERGGCQTGPQQTEPVECSIRVLAPHWIQANRLIIYVNGRETLRQTIGRSADEARTEKGVAWSGTIELRLPAHDCHVVAVALGPGIDEPYWRTAKPYQPTSPTWNPRVMGISGAIWVDRDGNERFDSANDYARRLCDEAEHDMDRLLASLTEYDSTVSSFAALHLWQDGVRWLEDDQALDAVADAPDHVRRGILAFVTSLRENALSVNAR